MAQVVRTVCDGQEVAKHTARKKGKYSKVMVGSWWRSSPRGRSSTCRPTCGVSPGT